MTALDRRPSLLVSRPSLPRVVLLHLVPGVPLALVAVASAPLLRAWHLPPVWGLLVGIVVVQVPMLEMLGRRLGGIRPAAAGAAHPLILTAATTAACLLLPGLVAWAEPVLRTTVFGWIPAWWSPSPATPASTLPATIALWCAAAVLAGPIAEERYFRGVLLPLVPFSPLPAAVLTAALFAAYHVWEPWAMATVLLTTLPITVARSMLRLGVVGCCVAHCTVNAVMLAALVVGVLAR